MLFFVTLVDLFQNVHVFGVSVGRHMSHIPCAILSDILSVFFNQGPVAEKVDNTGTL